MVKLHRALAEVRVESVRHFFNLAAVQIRRELLDLAKHHFGPQGDAANHHTDRQPADEIGGSLHAPTTEPQDLESWSEFHNQVSLKIVWLDFVKERDSEVLKSIPTLTEINGQSVFGFWKSVETPAN